jgi:hypothetical protein
LPPTRRRIIIAESGFGVKIPDEWFWDQPCYYCEKPAGPKVVQHESTYELVCPRCIKINELREILETVFIWLGVVSVWLALTAWKLIANQSWLKKGNVLAVILVHVLLPAMVIAAIFLHVRVYRVIKRRAVPSPAWTWSNDTPFILDEAGEFYVVEPPFRDSPARLHIGHVAVKIYLSTNDGLKGQR